MLLPGNAIEATGAELRNCLRDNRPYKESALHVAAVGSAFFM